MQSDIDHFSTLKPPLAPNTKEVDIYKKYIKGRVLLLGYTAMLYELCTNAMDISPPSTLPFVIKQDWFTINTFYDTIIGDGVLNLVGGSLVEHLSNYCNTLVIRFFTEKIDGMKYATYFSYNTNFLLPNVIINTQPKCKILVWYFKSRAP